MNEFLMFYAPFIVLICAFVVAFVVAPMDGAVRKVKKRMSGSGRRVASVFCSCM